jgi:flavin-dependent dehydrogenase
MELDVAIIGGGPAGSAAALTLAQAGLCVTLFERTIYGAARIGETLPPEICLPLQRLGVWEQFKRAGHLASPGIVSCWGSAEPFENDFLFNPYGCGWHVDRAAFDRMLAEAARGAGANLLLGTTVGRCAPGADGRWAIEARCPEGRRSFVADYLIEARGRTGGSRRDDNRPLRLDRLVGCAAFFDASGAADVAETRAVIEASPEGWWYSSSLPGGGLVVVFMTDADLLPHTQDGAAAYFRRRLGETGLTRRRLARGAKPGAFRRFAADTRWRPAVSAKMLAAGDAAMTFDPLSSQGVFKALDSGQRGARALLDARAGSETALAGYAEAMARDFQTYMETRSHFYRAEQRWPASAFWRRRHHAQFTLGRHATRESRVGHEGA